MRFIHILWVSIDKSQEAVVEHEESELEELISQLM